MTELEKISIIERLRNDADYYGEYGNQFLSNSMIGTLLTDPFSFGKSKDTTKEMIEGRYFHQRILDPEREERMVISPENSRNAKAYKEAVQANGGEPLLLQKEADELEPIIKRVESNEFFIERLRGDRDPNGFDIEEPMVGEIHGTLFKAKADRVNRSRGMIFDLKTTSDLKKFRSSFYRYGYDTQAYIYSELFGMEFALLVVDKQTGGLAYFTVSEQTLAEAEQKVIRALEIKDFLFGDEGAIDQHVQIEVI